MEGRHDELRRDAMAYGMLDHAVRAMRAASDVLSDAEIVAERIGNGGENTSPVSINNRCLGLNFGSYRAQVIVADSALTFQSHERDHDDAKVRVGSGHLRITLQVDVECVAPNSGGDK